MRAGSLRDRATIQARSSGLDALGQSAVEWVDVVTVWCNVNPLSGRELIAAQQSQAEITHKIILRYRPGITASLRMLFKGRVFDIHSVINSRERSEFLELLCTEGVTNG